MSIRGRGRMFIRNSDNTGWIDVVVTPVYVRDATNTSWVRLVPNEFYMMNQRSSGWMLIDDQSDPAMDNPCVNLSDGDCTGSPTDATAGSGDGRGSSGPAFDVVKGYPVGYDMPDAMYASFGLRSVIDVAPLGMEIYRPKLRVAESYDPIGLSSFEGLGRYSNPNVLNASVASRGAKITETVYRCGQTDGVVEILFACYDANGISVDVYYMGIRVATTCGFHVGRGKLHFDYAPTQNQAEERIFIRVRGEESSFWSLQVPYIKYPSTHSVAGVTPVSITILGLSSIYENSVTSYSCSLLYSDGSSRLVTPLWGVTTSPPIGTSLSSSGALNVGPLNEDHSLVITASYTESAKTMTASKPVNLLHRAEVKTALFGFHKLITDDTGFDGAFLASLTQPIRTVRADTGSGGEYQIVISPNTTTTANNIFAYVALPKSLFGYAFFQNTSDGTYGDAGSWDGVRAYDDNVDPNIAYSGGFEFTIDGETWVIYRNDYPFEDLAIIFNFKTHSSSLVSGLP
jgi:hypothetical protein